MGITPDMMKNAEKFAHINNKVVLYDELMKLANALFHKDNAFADRIVHSASALYRSIYTGKDDYKEALSRIQSEMTSNKAAELRKILDRNSGMGFVVTDQLEHIIKGGLINNPEFLNEALHIAKKDIADPKKYTSIDEMKEIIKNIMAYADTLVENTKNLKGKDLSKVLEKVQHKTAMMKLGYVVIGLGISALFLSTLITKMQYYITKKRTGRNSFPGVTGLEQDIKAKGYFN